MACRPSSLLSSTQSEGAHAPLYSKGMAQPGELARGLFLETALPANAVCVRWCSPTDGPARTVVRARRLQLALTPLAGMAPIATTIKGGGALPLLPKALNEVHTIQSSVVAFLSDPCRRASPLI